VLRRRKSDPLARQAVLAIAAGRVAIGVGTLLATAPALRLLGFAEVGASGTALARLAGSRDVAIGLVTIAVRDDRAKLRQASLLAAAVDAADAVAFGLATRDRETADAGVRGLGAGAAAALTGAWAARRL
jgi:hypothetical protein